MNCESQGAVLVASLLLSSVSNRQFLLPNLFFTSMEKVIKQSLSLLCSQLSTHSLGSSRRPRFTLQAEPRCRRPLRVAGGGATASALSSPSGCPPLLPPPHVRAQLVCSEKPAGLLP